MAVPRNCPTFTYVDILSQSRNVMDKGYNITSLPVYPLYRYWGMARYTRSRGVEYICNNSKFGVNVVFYDMCRKKVGNWFF
jgi:hypothetical protein